jgi:hypothetical protein
LPGAGTLYSPWCKDSIGTQGSYNLNVAVDPTTPDIVYLSSVSLWKAARDNQTGNWLVTDIGKSIHPDNHAFAFESANKSSVIYAGNDGGIYKSNDGGESWNNTINEGLCITQFGYMAQHPKSDAAVLAGTQDNGTLQYNNNSVFYTGAGGDGGCVAIDPDNPNNVLHEYYNASPERSTQGGKKESWIDVSAGLEGNSYFYPPFSLDKSNPRNIAFGTDRVFLDTNQGLNRWRKPETLEGEYSCKLPGTDKGEPVTAINYVNSSLIYVATESGEIFRLTKGDNYKWDVVSLNVPKLPKLWVWDVETIPGDFNTIVVGMSGYASDLPNEPTSHVWRGKVSASDGKAKWTDISGTPGTLGLLPNVPVNAIAIDDEAPDTMYIGTDAGVFRTNDGGKNWIPFNEGLPNCAVYDIGLHYSPKKLLRAVTHGRGIWERMLDVDRLPAVDIFVRDHVMDTGRFTPSVGLDGTYAVPAAFDDRLQDEDPDKSIRLGQLLWWGSCPDIKVDSPIYQIDRVEDVDYVKFETKLFHRPLLKENVNRIYVQIHNRGIKPADNVTIQLFYANIIDSPSGLPDLPQDFWTTFTRNSKDTSNGWKSIGEAKTLPSPPKTLTNTEPTVLWWEWNTPSNVTDLVWLLLVVDSPEDPIPESNKKIFNVGQLVVNEKHIATRLVSVGKYTIK